MNSLFLVFEPTASFVDVPAKSQQFFSYTNTMGNIIKSCLRRIWRPVKSFTVVIFVNNF